MTMVLRFQKCHSPRLALEWAKVRQEFLPPLGSLRQLAPLGLSLHVRPAASDAFAHRLKESLGQWSLVAVYFAAELLREQSWAPFWMEASSLAAAGLVVDGYLTSPRFNDDQFTGHGASGESLGYSGGLES